MKVQKPRFAFALDMIKTPDGFTREVSDHGMVNGWRFDEPTLKLVGHDEKTTILIILDREDTAYALAHGHTTFETSQGSFSFDRLGVCDSFYVERDSTIEETNKDVLEQVAKVVAARARHESSLKVPGWGFLITEEERVAIAEKIRTGGKHVFTPSGFGTGYELFSTITGGGKRRRPGYGFGMPASKELEAFFGVGPLTYNTLDCD